MPTYYRVGIVKLAVLSLCTFGLYGIYWFYQQWKAERNAGTESFSPGFRAVFSVFTAYSLFSLIHISLTNDDDKPGFTPGVYALAYFVLAAAWRMPGRYSLIGFLWFLPIIPVQQAINANVRKHDPRASLNETWEWWAFLLASVGGALLVLAVIGILFPQIGE